MCIDEKPLKLSPSAHIECMAGGLLRYFVKECIEVFNTAYASTLRLINIYSGEPYDFERPFDWFCWRRYYGSETKFDQSFDYEAEMLSVIKQVISSPDHDMSLRLIVSWYSYEIDIPSDYANEPIAKWTVMTLKDTAARYIFDEVSRMMESISDEVDKKVEASRREEEKREIENFQYDEDEDYAMLYALKDIFALTKNEVVKHAIKYVEAFLNKEDVSKMDSANFTIGVHYPQGGCEYLGFYMGEDMLEATHGGSEYTEGVGSDSWSGDKWCLPAYGRSYGDLDIINTAMGLLDLDATITEDD